MKSLIYKPYKPLLVNNTQRRYGENSNTYNSVKLSSFVSLRPSLSILCLSCAELTEILGSARGDICKELHLYATQWLTFAVVSFKAVIKIVEGWLFCGMRVI